MVLAVKNSATQLDWNKVHFLFGDERAVPPTHQDGNFALANTLLFTTEYFGHAHPSDARKDLA